MEKPNNGKPIPAKPSIVALPSQGRNFVICIDLPDGTHYFNGFFKQHNIIMNGWNSNIDKAVHFYFNANLEKIFTHLYQTTDGVYILDKAAGKKIVNPKF